MEKEKLENEFSNERMYLREFCYHDGYKNITLNIAGIDTVHKWIAIAVTDEGKITVQKFDLGEDEKGRLYFEFGRNIDKIEVDDFEKIEDEN